MRMAPTHQIQACTIFEQIVYKKLRCANPAGAEGLRLCLAIPLDLGPKRGSSIFPISRNERIF